MWLPLIVIVAILLILVLSKKISSYRKSGTEVPETKEAKKEVKKERKKFGWGWIAVVMVVIILAISGYGGYRYFSTQPRQQTAVERHKVRQEQEWKLCWEKIPGAEGATDKSSLCMPANLEITPDSIIITYTAPNGGKGTMHATPSNKPYGGYDGNWQDNGGWGQFHLRFATLESAVGWVDEKGSKPINLWLTAKSS